MSRIINFFRGTVEMRFTDEHGENVINYCAQKGVNFWNTKKLDDGTFLLITNKKYLKLLRGRYPNCTYRKMGLPAVWIKLKRRWWLIFAASFFVIVFWTVSHFIWDIQVYGNENVKTSEILRVLDEQGVSPGTFGLSVNSESLANRMLYEIPELSWFAININGSRAQVLVRERVDIPEVVKGEDTTAVFAEKSGIILEIDVFDGTRMFNVGDTVIAGDILVSGVTGSLSSGTRTEHAMAYVKARTWYKFTASMPKLTNKKTYTGDTCSHSAVIIAGRRINLYADAGAPFENCDADTTTKKVTLPAGGVLPITLVNIKYSEYTVEQVETDTEACEDILKNELSNRLRAELLSGNIISYAFETSEKNGTVTVTLRAECQERIDGLRLMTEEEIEQGIKREEEKVPEW